MMNRLPGVDDCLPPSKRYTGATVFDTAKYNDDVLAAIQKFKSENKTSFSDKFDLNFGGLPALLQILLETLLGETTMDHTCAKYLCQHLPLVESLLSAYATQNYASILHNTHMPPQVAEHLQLTYSGLSSSGSNHSLKAAFEEKYRGNTARLFIETLDNERRMAFGTPATGAPYNWSISVVQSSGTGKSRMVDESGNTVFTFPINIRECLPDGRLTYPPPDKGIRSFLMDCQFASDEQQQVNYAIFLRTLFTLALELVQSLFPGQVGEELALSWANYLKEAQTEESVGTNREAFYGQVVKNSKEAIRVYNTSFGLTIALVRGMALQAKDCHESIDLVIPIHIGPPKAPISSKTTSAINLQIKNRKTSEKSVVDRTITVPNLDLPVISIIFEFGVTENRQVPIHIFENVPPNTHQESNVDPNDHHYQIVAHGCSSAVFAAIPPETESQYQMILGGRTAMQDFPRKSNPGNLDAFLQMKSAFSVERQRERYNKRT